MSTNNGGPAFPAQDLNHQTGNWETVMGMSLRDYFAAKVMLGVLSSGRAHPYFDKAFLAETSYKMADAMLAAREAK